MKREYRETCGMMPNQAEGTIDGNPWYFRARHGSWDMCIVKPGHDPVASGPAHREGAILYYRSGDDERAGWWDKFDDRVHKLLDEFEAGSRGEADEVRTFEELTPEEVEQLLKAHAEEMFRPNTILDDIPWKDKE